MTALDLTGVRRATILAPHPDDEIIAAFGLIRALRRHGAAVRVVVVTDGAASHPNSVRWSADQLRAARRAESTMGLARAGLGRADTRFLGHADGGLHAYQRAQLGKLAQEISRGPAPDLLVLPSTADNHPDHRAVGKAAALTWRGTARRLSYIVWPQSNRQALPMTHAVHLDRTAHVMKHAALLCHRTQTGLIADDPTGFNMTTEMIARFTRPIERFRVLR